MCSQSKPGRLLFLIDRILNPYRENHNSTTAVWRKESPDRNRRHRVSVVTMPALTAVAHWGQKEKGGTKWVIRWDTIGMQSKLQYTYICCFPRKKKGRLVICTLLHLAPASSVVTLSIEQSEWAEKASGVVWPLLASPHTVQSDPVVSNQAYTVSARVCATRLRSLNTREPGTIRSVKRGPRWCDTASDLRAFRAHETFKAARQHLLQEVM